jgi:hypothetical protein
MNAQPRTFTASDAVRGEVPLMVGIMSPSGGGKTYSALRLATGMQRVLGGDIYGIDTENNRMRYYADKFRFKHVPFVPPFGSLDYLDAVRWCVSQGSRVTIIDSMTHEHIGQGGYLETAEAVIDRIAGQDWKKREAVKMLGWATAGPLRQKMIEGLKQLPGAFIFCFRAKEKTKPIKKGDGKTDVVDMGFMPIAGEEWIYEMAVNCMLEPRSDGVPTWRSDQIGERLMMKLPEQFKDIFAETRPLSEEIGEAMAKWARGDAAPSTPRSAIGAAGDLRARGDAAARVGTAALGEFWKGLARADRHALGAAQLDAWKAIAAGPDTPDIEFNSTTSGALLAQPDAAAAPILPGTETGEASSASSSPKTTSPDPSPCAPEDVRHALLADLMAEGAARVETGLDALNAWLAGLPDDELALVKVTQRAAWREQAGRVRR